MNILCSRGEGCRMEVEDTITWSADKSGAYSVCSFYKIVEMGWGSREPVLDIIWRGVAPLKAKFLGWLV